MTEDFGKNGPPHEGKKPGKSGVSAASLDVGPEKAQNGQKSEMDCRLVYAPSAIAENAASP